MQIDALDKSGSNTIRSILVVTICQVLTSVWPGMSDLVAAHLPAPQETFPRTVDLNVFGDATEKVTVKSDGNVEMHAKDGYAVTQHRFAKAGDYLVRVERANERGQKAVGHLHVLVESR